MAQYFRQTLLLFLAGTLFFIGHVEGSEVIAILCCDTLAAGIESATDQDLKNMHEEAHRIAINTKSYLREILFTGEDLVPDKVLAALNGLTCKRDDMILFYFSGHGYRTSAKEGNPWPNLFFTASSEGVDYETIEKILLTKRPRFLLAIADCCNNYVDKGARKPCLVKSASSRIRLNYKELFKDSKGAILITSSQAGEYSWCNSSGSVYTCAFVDSIQDEVLKSKRVSWDALLKRATLGVASFQKPYILRFSKIPKP